MGQYKSIWTGQQIDDGIDRVNLVITVRVSTEVSDDFAAVEAAWGKKTIIAVYDRNEQQYHSKYSMLCIRRYDDYGDTVYLFGSAVDGRIKTCELRRDSGSGRAMWTIKPDTILVSLPLLNGTLQTLRETLAYMSSEDDGAWSNIPAGSYVYDNDYEEIYKADKDIQAGEALVTYGANKNVTKIDNGGLNDLKSAITNVETDLAAIHATGTTNTTGATIPVGKLFYLNDLLVIARQSIISGATFTKNTNYAEVPDGGLNMLSENTFLGGHYEYYPSGGTTASIDLSSIDPYYFSSTSMVFIIVCISYNTAVDHGLYIATAAPNYEILTPIKTANGMTVTLSNTTLNISTTEPYQGIKIFKIR